MLLFNKTRIRLGSSEFVASLVYIVNSRTTRATQINQKKKKKKKERKKRKEKKKEKKTSVRFSAPTW